MTGRDGPRAALVLHLFHEDVALELLRRVAALGADVDIVATGPRPSKAVAAALAGIPRADWVETRNEGFDVAPFLAILPLLERRGYDLVCKLHTKRGNSGFGRQWREALLDALIGSGDVVAGTIAAFATTPDLAMVGPEGLYLSAAANMTANADAVRRLAPIVFPALELPADWGFFAGTMFWTRVAQVKPFARLRGIPDVWEGDESLRDGGTAHAVERLFGLIPVMADGRVGLRSGGGPLRLTRDTGAPVEILKALARLGRPSPAPSLSRTERSFVRRNNPLVHYLSSAGAAADPHPLFASDWYRARNALPAGTNPLAHFLGMGAMAADPSPLFPAAGYVQRRPWLRRRDRNPLLHHLLELDALGRADEPDEPGSTARPHSTPKDPFARAARLQQLRAFLGGSEALSFAVKIGAARDSPSEWGDIHFATGLTNALAAAGNEARVDYREDWYRRRDPADAVIALRGPVRYEPSPDAFNILWIVSHPDQVSFEEMAEYDLVYVASESFAGLLRHWIDVPVLSLLQATDQSRFTPPSVPVAADGLFFAGNTRGQDRPVVRWALELGLPLEIYGFGWKDTVPPRGLQAERIPNAELPARYSAAVAVLGDHWPAMVDFGFVANRLFDVLAAGGTPISDAFPAISTVLGNAVLQIETKDELAPAVAAAAARPLATRLAHAGHVRRHHGFAARAATIAGDISALPDRAFRRPAPRRGPRVRLVYDAADARTSWMVARRLLGPLTTDHAALRSLSVGGPGEPVPSATDVVIAVPGPASKPGDWERLLEDAGSRRIVVDTGALRSRSHRPPARLEALFAAASQVWWPGVEETAPSGRLAAQDHLVPDSVDPRLWRDYHRASQWEFAAAPLRCVVVAPEGIEPAVAAILEGTFAGGRAELTVVTPAPTSAGPWTSTPFPAGKSAYASFARWFRARKFHAGLCFGAAGSRDADLAFLDFSAAGLLSIAPTELLGDPEIAARTLVVPVETDWSDLSAVLARLSAAPARYAGLAAASTTHVWRSRSAAAAGTIIKRLLDV